MNSGTPPAPIPSAPLQSASPPQIFNISSSPPNSFVPPKKSHKALKGLGVFVLVIIVLGVLVWLTGAFGIWMRCKVDNCKTCKFALNWRHECSTCKSDYNKKDGECEPKIKQ